jgi:putative phosphoribosyl transferase
MWNDEVLDWSGLDSQDVAAIRARETSMLNKWVADYRTWIRAQVLVGKTAVIVDDGIATGSGAMAACQVARMRGAAHIVVAVPVAPVGWEARFHGFADQCVAVRTPEPFRSVGSFYEDFHQVGDAEVRSALMGPHEGLAHGRDGS